MGIDARDLISEIRSIEGSIHKLIENMAHDDSSCDSFLMACGTEEKVCSLLETVEMMYAAELNNLLLA